MCSSDLMADWTAQRNKNMQFIFDSFGDTPFFTVHKPSEDYVHAAYKCYVQVNLQALPKGWTRDRIMQVINDQQVPCYSGSCSEVYLEKAFDNTPWRPKVRMEI